MCALQVEARTALPVLAAWASANAARTLSGFMSHLIATMQLQVEGHGDVFTKKYVTCRVTVTVFTCPPAG